MKVKIAASTNKVLDYLVAKAEGWQFCVGRMNDSREVWFERRDETGTFRVLQHEMRPSTDWAQGGPIIEREKIGVLPDDGHRFSQWRAFCWHPSQHDLTFEDATSHMEAGPTALIAAMRCFVASKLGDEVDVPQELMA